MAQSEAAQILEAVTRAALAASEAATALKESNEAQRAQRSGFSEASKVVKCPTSFGSQNSTEDHQTGWISHFLSSNGSTTQNLDMRVISNMLKTSPMILWFTTLTKRVRS